MTFEPIGKKLLIRRDPPVSQVGRVIIPGKHQNQSFFGTVVSSGPETKRKLNGKRVMIPALGGQEVDLADGVKLLFIDEDFIMATVREER